ncbi:MAG: type IV secretion system protein [Rickettsiaceae bacterium]|nr:type IV secretion system protein [Rickettsiaceae bacterium]
MHRIITQFLIIFILHSPIFAGKSYAASASSVLGSTDDLMGYLGCEAGYMADFMKYDFPNSCVEDTLLNYFTLHLYTLGLSTQAIIRLKIQNEDLFPGNCARENRADYDNPKLKFGFCNNVLLMSSYIQNAFEAIGTNSFKLPTQDQYMIRFEEGSGFYSGMGDVVFVNGTTSSAINFGGIPGSPTPVFAMAYRVYRWQDKICVQMLTPLGFQNIGCKYIKEPFPTSIYDIPDSMEDCRSLYGCAKAAETVSMTITPIISTILTCIKDTVVRAVLNKDTCSYYTSDANKGMSIVLSDYVKNNNSNGSTNLFFRFQSAMRGFVMAMLTLYVVSYGANIALNPDKTKSAQIVHFMFKIILVTYFSVGLNSTSTTSYDGISQYILPFLLKTASDMGSWFVDAAAINGLCDFPASLYEDNAGSISMRLWDQIDCKLAYYVGYDAHSEMKLGITTGDPTAHNIPPYMLLLLPAILFGNFDLVMAIISYLILVVSFVAYIVALYANSIILIVVLCALAPLIIPFCLFDYTKKYFDKWWKMLLSLCLQPVIGIVFLCVMFNIFDRTFYGTCLYKPITINYNKDSEPTKQYRVFYITTKESDYDDDRELLNGCISSLGYFLRYPFGSLIGLRQNNYPSSIDVNVRTDEYGRIVPTSQPNMIDIVSKLDLTWEKGVFTQSPKMVWELFVNLIKDMLMCYIVMAAFSNLINSATEFINNLSNSEVSGAGALTSGNMRHAMEAKAEKGVSQIEKARSNVLSKMKKR